MEKVRLFLRTDPRQEKLCHGGLPLDSVLSRPTWVSSMSFFQPSVVRILEEKFWNEV